MWKLQPPPSPQDVKNILVIREFSAEKLKMCFAKKWNGNQLVYEKFCKYFLWINKEIPTHSSYKREFQLHCRQII